ncbi:hypothetical protein LDJ79_07180 [Vibrio tritonius]|uniref:Secreted protein n=1 Tax=Vibrio tritonius TaxID=1435069 RepID=A0ABS7YJN4_9VIBR|nr:hypothetical protein [Vibrio tritonius]MCA2015888.1 hypothetical protein [Vibrio tritonius]
MIQALALGVSMVHLLLLTLRGYQLLLGSRCYEQCVCTIYLPSPSSSHVSITQSYQPPAQLIA